MKEVEGDDVFGSSSDEDDGGPGYGRHTRPMNMSQELKRQKCGQPYSLKYDLFALNNNKTLYQRDVKGHTGCVNSVEFSKDGNFVGSGGDDLRVFVWKAQDVHSGLNPEPAAIMKSRHTSNIFTMAFSNDSKRVYSAGNDGILIVHDIETGDVITSFDGNCFYSISLRGDEDHVVAAATDIGRIYFFDTRQSPNDPVQTINEYGETYCVSFNPREPYYLASCNKSKGLSIFDMRYTEDFYKRAGPATKKTIFASWDSKGENLFCIRSGGSPYYFNTNKKVPLLMRDTNYSNTITIKSCEFVHDKYGFTGSDDWNIYCWQIPTDYDDDVEQNFATMPETDKAFTVLKGHRSIINHVRHSPVDDVIISSGVEKIVKVWSGFQLPSSVRDPPRRTAFSNLLVYGSGQDDVEEDEETLRMFDAYSSMNAESSDSEDGDFLVDPTLGHDHMVAEYASAMRRRRLRRRDNATFEIVVRDGQGGAGRRVDNDSIHGATRRDLEMPSVSGDDGDDESEEDYDLATLNAFVDILRTGRFPTGGAGDPSVRSSSQFGGTFGLVAFNPEELLQFQEDIVQPDITDPVVENVTPASPRMQSDDLDELD